MNKKKFLEEGYLEFKNLLSKSNCKKMNDKILKIRNINEKIPFIFGDFKNKDFSSITVCVLDRPRHKKIIDKLKDLKVNIKLITDGDVLGALYVSDPKYDVDMFLGIGGGPEGVLAACALDASNCHFQGRFIFDNKKDIIEAKSMGITDLNKKYELNEIVKGDTLFCASGITTSEVLNGIIIDGDKFISETLVTHKNTNFKKIVKSINSINE